jgi:hypothetical protein
MLKAIAWLCTERDIDIGRSGVMTTRRSRDTRYWRFRWNGDRLCPGFDLVQFFPEDGEF